jgi:hypothetical protein
VGGCRGVAGTLSRGEARQRTSAVKRQMFEELLGSVREAGAILRGQQKPSRRIVIGSPSGRADLVTPRVSLRHAVRS